MKQSFGLSGCRPVFLVCLVTNEIDEIDSKEQIDERLVLAGHRELGDRSVPLRYVAGRRATENDAGGHFQHPATLKKMYRESFSTHMFEGEPSRTANEFPSWQERRCSSYPLEW